MGAYLAVPVTAKERFEGSGHVTRQDGEHLHLAYGGAAMQGWRRTMEDAHLAEVGLGSSNESAVFGVFDGHGGAEVALFCQRYMAAELAKLESFGGDAVEDALVDVFHRMDDMLRDHTFAEEIEQLKTREQEDQDDGEGGKGEDDGVSPMDALEMIKRVFQLKRFMGENGPHGDGDEDEHGEESAGAGERRGSGASGASGAARGGGGGGAAAAADDAAGGGDAAMGDDDEGPSGQQQQQGRSQPEQRQQQQQAQQHSDQQQEQQAGDGSGSGSGSGAAPPWARADTEAAAGEGGAGAAAERFIEPADARIQAGCTAVVAVIKSGVLYVANAGDSRGVLCRGGRAVAMSEDHKPAQETERTRILNAGAPRAVAACAAALGCCACVCTLVCGLCLGLLLFAWAGARVR